MLFAALIALDHKRPADRQWFEGISLGKWDFVSEHHVRAVMSLGVLADYDPAVAGILPSIQRRHKRPKCSECTRPRAGRSTAPRPVPAIISTPEN